MKNGKKQRVLRVLDSEEMKTVMSLDNIFHRAIMLLLYHTGLRVSELVSLSINDVMYSDATFKNQLTVTGKGNKQRTIPLSQKAKENLFVLIEDSKGKLKKLFNQDSPLIVTQKRTRMTREWVSKIIKKFREDNKIELQLTPHVFRHQFATSLIKRGANMKTVQTLLGHSSIAITLDTYTHTTNEDMRKAVSLLD